MQREIRSKSGRERERATRSKRGRERYAIKGEERDMRGKERERE